MEAKTLKKKIKKNTKKVPLTKLTHDELKKTAKKTKGIGVVREDVSNGKHISGTFIDNGKAENCGVFEDFSTLDSSTERAAAAFNWMIAPQKREEFYSTYFEKKAFVVRHHNAEYYKGVFSTKDLDEMLHKNDVYFSKNIDITSYVDQKRETHNPEGRALPSQVWSLYNDGCSVRLLNPQSYVESVQSLCSTLAEEFSSFVGSNVYLTPAGTQGFAPHWDDIDAFVLQLEGKKHWKVYAPRCPEEELPLLSSKNLERDELGKLVLEATLETGDLLYMPRGFIHEAHSLPSTHSLHITISTNQKNTWSDLFKIWFAGAIDVATAEDVNFRKTLPRDYLHVMGIMNSDRPSQGREQFQEMAGRLFDKLIRTCPLDSAVDQMAKNYIHDALPPLLTPTEAKQAAVSEARWDPSSSSAPAAELGVDNEVRLVRKTVCRIVTEGESVNMYYITDNSKVYREHEEPFCIEITPLEASVVEFLLCRYPEFTPVHELPYDGSEEDKVELATMLYQKGLLLAQ